MSYRIDVSKIDGPSIDVNGFMTARAKFTRTGVFDYLNFDGTISHELRHPDDVFDLESLASAQSQVVTNDHPPYMIFADNCKEYSVGFTSEKVDVTENKYIEGNLKVTCDKAINDVMQGGKNQLSEGYRCDVIEEAGIYEGVQYNKRQKNIRYNHLSIVWEGRAGPSVSIKTDAADKDFAVMKMDSENKSCKEDRLKVQSDKAQNKILEKTMTAKIKIDSIEFEVSETVAQAVKIKVDSLEGALTAAKDEASKAQATADVLKSDLAKKDSEIEGLKKDLSDEAIIARADELSKVRVFAKEVLGEDKKDSIEDLKKAVITKKTGIDCSKKDSVYVNTAFEALMTSHKPEVKVDALAETVGEIAGKQPESIDAKIKAHMDALNNRHKVKK